MMQWINQHPRFGLLIAVSMAALLTVLSKQTLERVDALLFTGLQVVFGVIFLLIINHLLRIEKICFDLKPRVWAYVVVIAFLNFIVARLFFLLSLEKLPVVTHAYLVNFTGIITMVFSSFILKEHPKILQWIGAIIAFMGLRFYFGEPPPVEQISGLVMASAVVLALALTNNLVRKLSKEQGAISPLQISILSAIVGAVCFALILVSDFLASSSPSLKEISIHDWVIILLNGLVIVAFGLTVFNIALAKIASYEVSLLASSGVIFAAIFAYILIQEPLTWSQLAGISIMAFGLWLVHYRARIKTKHRA